jgi:glutathione peroxidase
MIDSYIKPFIARLKCLIYGGFKLSRSESSPPSLLSLEIIGRDGQVLDLARYRGQVILIINTASKCGFTRQYDQLEELYNRYRRDGFVILAFPSNDFFQQEPGSDSEIESD